VWDLLTDKRVRLLVISFSILHAAQQLSGINAVFYYSTSFFKGIVANPLVGTAAAGTVNVIATYAALKLMDRYIFKLLHFCSSVFWQLPLLRQCATY
jgi:MFS transporter, SP family, solute carrier family 2 (facilitated glucose transporter), member 3